MHADWADRSADAGTPVNAGYVYGNNISYRYISGVSDAADGRETVSLDR